MKKQLVQESKIWTIETSGTSYTIEFGAISSKLRTSKKSFDSEEKCLKEAEKAIRAKEKGGYIEITINGGDAPLDAVYQVQMAQQGKCKAIHLSHYKQTSPRLLFEICKCGDLERLDLSTLHPIPKEIGNLRNLQFLKIQGLSKTSVPGTIAKLTNLKELELH